MSLCVYFITKDDVIFDEDELDGQTKSPGYHMFGTESWRYTLWGADIVRDLGCPLLNSLKEGNVYAYDEEIEKLKQECFVLSKNVEKLVGPNSVFQEQVQFRINNLLELIEIAQKHLDKVGIAIS